jgi:HAD superfamily hydrolase (TIGR01509 family)
MFTGLIFDFNGVLFWDDQLQRQSWRKFAAQLRPEPLTDEEINTHIHGRNGQYTLEYLLGHVISPHQADQWTENKETIYREMCLALAAGFKLSPGAISLLDALVADHIPHTIATASAKNNVDFFFRELHLSNWFDRTLVALDDGHIAGKPAPDLYLRAAQFLELDPSDCVVVEDSISGIQAAQNAGIGHIIALGPLISHPKLAQKPGVNQVISNLAEIDVASLFSR